MRPACRSATARISTARTISRTACPASSPNATGWLNRLLTALPAGAPIKSKGAIQIGDAPLILRGPAPVLGWSPTWFDARRRPDALHGAHALPRPAIRTLLRDCSTAALQGRPAGGASRRGRRRHQRACARASAAPAALIVAPTARASPCSRLDGWDTHADQGGITGEHGGACSASSITALGDFKTAVGAAWSQTVVVMVTEFGRTVRVNGDSGTDHGVGTVALLAGGAVNGGKVFGDWPGLHPPALRGTATCMPTTDLRSVFKGVLRRPHRRAAPACSTTSIFPDQQHQQCPPAAQPDQDQRGEPDGRLPGSVRRQGKKQPIARYRRGQKMSQPRYMSGAVGAAG